MTPERIAELRAILEDESISYGELVEIQDEFEKIDPTTLPEPAENAMPSNQLDEIEQAQSWREDGEMCPGGIVGGDGAGESQCRRWVRLRHDGNWDVLTVYAYPVFGPERGWDDEDERCPWHAELSTEALICRDITDPGSSEVSSDCWYDSDVSPFAYATEDEAQRRAVAALRAVKSP